MIVSFRFILSLKNQTKIYFCEHLISELALLYRGLRQRDGRLFITIPKPSTFQRLGEDQWSSGLGVCC